MAERAPQQTDRRLTKRIVKALKRREGQATAADIMVDTGIAGIEVERLLRSMISAYPCHLDVAEDGELLYAFEPAMRRFDQKGRMRRRLKALGRRLWAGFSVFMKGMIAVVMVAYVALFAVLAVAAMVAAANRGGSRRSYRPHHRSGGGGNFFFWYWLFGRPGRRRTIRPARQSLASRYGRPQKASDKRPFYSRVFSFVLGPDTAEIEPVVDEAALLNLIRSRRGVVTTADIAAHTGWSLTRSEHALTQLMGPFDGNIVVTDDGDLAFTFPGLLRTAGGGDKKTLPKFWERWERPVSVTGNTEGQNLLIGGLNLFNLVLAVITPSTIMVSLAIPATTLTLLGLSWFPLGFSTLVFAVPAIRWLAVRRENRRRGERNLRRSVYSELYAQAGGRDTANALFEAGELRLNRTPPAWAAGALPEATTERVIRDSVAALGVVPDVSSDVALAAEPAWDASALAGGLAAGADLRQRVRDEAADLKLVFSTREDSEEEILSAEIAAAESERAEAIVH